MLHGQISQDLAVKTIEEIWFSDLANLSSDARSHSPSPTPGGPKAALRTKAAVFMEVAGLFKERQSPLEQFLRQVSMAVQTRLG